MWVDDRRSCGSFPDRQDHSPVGWSDAGLPPADRARIAQLSVREQVPRPPGVGGVTVVPYHFDIDTHGRLVSIRLVFFAFSCLMSTNMSQKVPKQAKKGHGQGGVSNNPKPLDCIGLGGVSL
jgi:hypothetical protein